MCKRIKMNYNWKNMKKDVEKYVKACLECARAKIKRKTCMPMAITSTATTTFEKICLDIVGPLPITENGNKYILTVQDDLSKFICAFPLQDQETETIAKVFTEKFICIFGVPKSVLTDNGSNFVSKLFHSVCKLFNIKKINISAYHPESNGSLERTHRTLKEFLRAEIEHENKDWDLLLPYGCFAFNTTPHSTTNFTPYELLFGKTCMLPHNLKNQPDIVYNYDDYLLDLKYKLQFTQHKAKQNIIHNKEISKSYFDKTQNPIVLSKGDQVFLDHIPTGTGQKLQILRKGPYEVISCTSKTATISVKGKQCTVHKNRLIKA